MKPKRNPAAISREERFQELAEILSRGYLRHLVQRRISSDPLALPPHPEAPCVSPVNTEKESA